jgi:hypothetical protein
MEMRNFTLTGSGSFVDTTAGGSSFDVVLTGPSGTVVKFDTTIYNPDKNDGSTISPTFSTSGTLIPFPPFFCAPGGAPSNGIWHDAFGHGGHHASSDASHHGTATAIGTQREQRTRCREDSGGCIGNGKEDRP